MTNDRSAPSRAGVVLPFAPSSAAAARRELRRWLHARHCRDDVNHDAQLVVSELVGNACRHASPLANGTIVVRWELDDEGVIVSVTDGGGSDRPHTVDADPESQGGRGLAIVDTLSSRWWFERQPHRSTVHALLPIA